LVGRLALVSGSMSRCRIDEFERRPAGCFNSRLAGPLDPKEYVLPILQLRRSCRDCRSFQDADASHQQENDHPGEDDGRHRHSIEEHVPEAHGPAVDRESAEGRKERSGNQGCCHGSHESQLSRGLPPAHLRLDHALTIQACSRDDPNAALRSVMLRLVCVGQFSSFGTMRGFDASTGVPFRRDDETMPRETKKDEHGRLQKRTGELKQDHAALDRDVTPFHQGDHDRHNANLKKHKADLVRHRKRSAD
jgi:hypothetical protein